MKNDTHELNFYLVIFCIIAAYFIYQFFTQIIPDGEYITNKVKVTDEQTEENYYLNLLVSVGQDGDGSYYYVHGIISPSTGELIKTDCESDNFGRTAYFWPMHSDLYTYSVTLNYSDLNVSALDRIKAQPIGFLVRVAAFLFLAYMLIINSKKPKKGTE